MTSSILKTVFQFRRDTAANWEINKDAIPAEGEPCFVIDKNILKVGDGFTKFCDLKPIRCDVEILQSDLDVVKSDTKALQDSVEEVARAIEVIEF
jgi:hypothetical protein